MMEGTLIGFDFGSRRIGVAVGETSTRIASPLGAIEGEANEARFAAIGRIVDEWKPAGFVVGRPPNHPDGTEHRVARLAEKFGRRLEARYKVPVRLFPIDAFPVTEGTNATKIQKHKLRDLALQKMTVA